MFTYCPDGKRDACVNRAGKYRQNYYLWVGKSGRTPAQNWRLSWVSNAAS